MDKDKFNNQKRKESKACPVGVIEVEFLNHDYKLKLPMINLVSDTGLLEIGELISSKVVFKFRWDEKPGKIDIDLYLNGKKSKPENFSGHHTEQISEAPNREYQFEIKYKEELIFKAIIGVSITTENRIEKSLRYTIKGEKKL